MARSEAQRRADARWEEKNKEAVAAKYRFFHCKMPRSVADELAAILEAENITPNAFFNRVAREYVEEKRNA